jgi:hypothetical protein
LLWRIGVAVSIRRERVLHILRRRDPFQVGDAIIGRVSVLVIDLYLVVSFRQSEGDGHQTVDKS